MTSTSDFHGGTDQMVFACDHVWEGGAPILLVVHEGDGTWQFLCGGDHTDSEPAYLCLAHVLERDATLRELSDLPCSHSAEREEVGASWDIVDDGDKKLRADIAEHGWHVVGVRAGEGEPAFAYSVGMTETLDHPEIIMVGLPIDMMVTLINDLGALIKDGERPTEDQPVQRLIGSGHCMVREVTRANRSEYLRYACAHYDSSAGFQALQCFWPSKTGKFPWDEAAHPDYLALQPDLSLDN